MIEILTLLAIFTAIDAVWLGKVAPSFYKKHIGHVMRRPPDWTAAALFYFGYIAAIFYLGYLPAESSIEALKNGATLGVFAYATYDLTNKATIKSWPWTVVIVDLAWGTFLSGSALWLTYTVVN